MDPSEDGRVYRVQRSRFLQPEGDMGGVTHQTGLRQPILTAGILNRRPRYKLPDRCYLEGAGEMPRRRSPSPFCKSVSSWPTPAYVTKHLRTSLGHFST